MSDPRHPAFHPFGSRREASEALAVRLAELLAGAVSEEGAARLGVHRISLTPHALLGGGALFLLFFGAEKRAVYEAALKGDDELEYPVRTILHQDRVPVAVFWAP